MFPNIGGRAALLILVAAVDIARANTTITFTRNDVATMATLWETDSAAISPLTNAQYPNIGVTWDYIVPHSSISADGDIHVDMAVDSAGSGSSSNNIGESPIIAEVINASSPQLSHLDSLSGHEAIFRGIFRFYTEHSSERHFEIHPATQLQTWNGAGFVL